MINSIPPITVLSRAEAQDHTPVPREVAISINDMTGILAPLRGEYEAVLALRFADVQPLGAEGSITAGQADAIVAFVLGHREAPALMIHCGAGISRSPGVAAGLEEGLELPPIGRPTANRAVADAVRAAVQAWFSVPEAGVSQTPGDALKAGILDNLAYGERLVAEAHQAGLLTDEEHDAKLSAYRAQQDALLKEVPIA